MSKLNETPAAPVPSAVRRTDQEAVYKAIGGVY